MGRLGWCRRAVRTPVLSIALLAAPGIVRAEEQPSNDAATDAPPEGAPPNPAEAAYNRAIRAYAQGDKLAALADMRESYRLSHYPDLLYNIARLERELNDCRGSLAHYEEYQREAPSGSYAATTSTAIAQLSQECGDAPKQPAPVSHDASYWNTTRIIGWSAIGAAAATGAAALAFQLSAEASASDYATTKRSLENPGAGTWDASSAIAEQNAANRAVTAARVFAVSSGVLLIGGVMLLTLFSNPHESAPPHVSFSVEPRGGFIGYSRGF